MHMHVSPACSAAVNDSQSLSCEAMCRVCAAEDAVLTTPRTSSVLVFASVALVQVFYFPNGQTEAHHVDGSKEILFPDGTLRCVLRDGSERLLDASNLSEAVLTPQPQRIESMLDGFT
jgi:hypothetical protein